MKKRLSGILIILTLISSLLLVNVYSVEQNKAAESRVPDKLMIAHTEVFGELERPGIVFNHSAHAEKQKKEGCKACHPVNEDGNCNFAFPFSADNKTSAEIKDLYHKKCIGCHEKENRTSRKALPVRCGECHRKDMPLIKHSVVEFDFSVHEKHTKALNDKCILCHHSYDKEDRELVYEEGTEQSCYYCHDLKEKRSPLLEAEASVTTKKGLGMRKVSHELCVNCHIDIARKGEKAGPVECLKCHTGKYKTIAGLKDIPRMKMDQPKVSFISIEEGQMKGVPFDHAFHEKNAATCRSCHHQTLKSCKHCHSLKGSPEGKWINTAGAYHDVLSAYSCAGCHSRQKSQKECSGCHHHLTAMDLQAKGPKKEFCKVCHSGRNEVATVKPLPLAELNPQKVPEKVTIKVLEKEYETSVFPHLRIIKKLAEVSNQSKMANHFHGDIRTICTGCHHESRAEAEAKANKPPFCKSCHSINFDQKNMNRPRLLAIYHRQCMGCHEKMQIKATGCRDCHKEKNVHN